MGTLLCVVHVSVFLSTGCTWISVIIRVTIVIITVLLFLTVVGILITIAVMIYMLCMFHYLKRDAKKGLIIALFLYGSNFFLFDLFQLHNL